MNVNIDNVLFRIEEPPSEMPAQKRIVFSGNPASDSMLIMDISREIIPSEEKMMLTRMLKALGRDVEEVVMVDYMASAEKHFSRYSKIASARYVLAFGISPKQLHLGLDVRKNEAVKFGHHQIIFSDSLGALNGNENLKKPLWNALVKMYGIKKS